MLMRAMKTAGLPTGDGYPRPLPPSEPHVITDKEFGNSIIACIVNEP